MSLLAGKSGGRQSAGMELPLSTPFSMPFYDPYRLKGHISGSEVPMIFLQFASADAGRNIHIHNWGGRGRDGGLYHELLEGTGL